MRSKHAGPPQDHRFVSFGPEAASAGGQAPGESRAPSARATSQAAPLARQRPQNSAALAAFANGPSVRICRCGAFGDGRTEAEHILGFMLDRAVKARIPCNTLLLAYTNVMAFEQRRAAGRLA